MRKGMLIFKKAGFRSVEDLPRTAVGFSLNAYQDLPPQLRSSATSKNEQRVRVLVPNTQGLHRTTQFRMHKYLNLLDWKSLELSSTQRKCKAGVKKYKRSTTVWAEWIKLKETLAKFQAERGKETSDNKGSDDMTSWQKPNARGNKTQAQWNFAAEAWLEVMYGIPSPTTKEYEATGSGERVSRNS